MVNAHHIQYVRRAHNIETNGEFCYIQNHVSPKYSRAFVNWIVDQFNADTNFFEKAKALADQVKVRPSQR